MTKYFGDRNYQPGFDFMLNQPFDKAKLDLGAGQTLDVLIIDTPDAGRIAITPFENIDPQTNLLYAELTDVYGIKTKPSRKEVVLKVKGNPLTASNSFSRLARYCKKALNELEVKVLSHSEMVELARGKLFEDHIKYHSTNTPGWNYPQTIDEDPETQYYSCDVYQHFGLFTPTGEVVSIITYTIDHTIHPSAIYWSRTLRSFEPQHQIYRPGHTSVYALLHAAYLSDLDLNLGLRLPYKPEMWKTNGEGPWKYTEIDRLNISLENVL